MSEIYPSNSERSPTGFFPRHYILGTIAGYAFCGPVLLPLISNASILTPCAMGILVGLALCGLNPRATPYALQAASGLYFNALFLPTESREVAACWTQFVMIFSLSLMRNKGNLYRNLAVTGLPTLFFGNALLESLKTQIPLSQTPLFALSKFIAQSCSFFGGLICGEFTKAIAENHISGP